MALAVAIVWQLRETEPLSCRDFIDQVLPHVPESEVKISFRDRGWLFGDTAFDVARTFGGKPFKVTAPMRAVLAGVARENGAGMSFPEESHDDEPPPENGSDKPGRPALRVVK